MERGHRGDSMRYICSGVKECEKLKDATNIIMYGDKEVTQRPEYCSGRHPHRFRHEEDRGGFICPFINKRIESIKYEPQDNKNL